MENKILNDVATVLFCLPFFAIMVAITIRLFGEIVLMIQGFFNQYKLNQMEYEQNKLNNIQIKIKDGQNLFPNE